MTFPRCPWRAPCRDHADPKRDDEEPPGTGDDQGAPGLTTTKSWDDQERGTDHLTGRGTETAEDDRELTEAERFPGTWAHTVSAAVWLDLTTGYLPLTGNYLSLV
jgi:hypothetical protein